jgi:ABC-type multidrug transport system fused ATPase/permease subunit
MTLASLLAAACEAAILASVAQAAAALVDGTQHVTTTVGPLHLDITVRTLLGVALGLAAVRFILQVPLAVIPARLAADVQSGMQKRLFLEYTHASWTEQSRDREGHLQELMSNQIIQATVATFAATGLVASVLAVTVLAVSAFLLSPVAAIVVCAATIVIFAVLRPLNRLVGRWSRGLSSAQMTVASGVGEAARLAEETHVFGVADARYRRIETLVATARHLLYRQQLVARFTPGAYQTCVYMLAIAGLGAMSLAHTGHVASLGAVVLLLLRAGTYGQGVQGSYQLLRQSWPYVVRVREADRRYSSSVPAIGSRRLGEVRSLSFEHVSFAYVPDRPVLFDLNATITGGETIGIIGPSGAGKSTIVQLLLRLRVPTAGRYLVNGRPATQFAPEDWHRQVAYVPQDPKLIHASVADNIRYFRELPDAAVEHAARLARIHDDIEAWHQGYDTMVGPRADAVSGGQQQRICIARALVAEPEVLVLDEPTSALDPRSESLLQDSLAALKGRITVVIVAHRMSTLDVCDRVIVLADGRIDAFDTAERLRDGNAYYRFASVLARAGVAAEPR